MRVAIVAEFYPRRADPVLGVWAHRQAVAARDAGAQVEVFVLYRVVPPAASFGPRALLELALRPRRTSLDGIEVRYLPFVSPRRERSYARWGLWAAPVLARALRSGGGGARWDLVHAHNAVPAGDAVLRARTGAPLLVSVHGGDVLWTSSQVRGGRRAVRRTLARAQLVLANSAAIETSAREHGARRTRVLHLGSDLPPTIPERADQPTVVSVGHLVARKRHADVLRAVASLPGVRYLVIGDGPERAALERLASQLGVAARVEFAGQLAPGAALVRARSAWLMAMPSTEEAFGVAYVEAMAAGVPAIGARGEGGPEEIAAAGGGIELIAPRDVEALAQLIRSLLGDRARLAQLRREARANVEANFTWRHCGAATLAAYRDVRR
ncbi:MAG: glycosyltransferase [Solirubrobacteraceae bacterium]